MRVLPLSIVVHAGGIESEGKSYSLSPIQHPEVKIKTALAIK